VTKLNTKILPFMRMLSNIDNVYISFKKYYYIFKSCLGKVYWWIL